MGGCLTRRLGLTSLPVAPNPTFSNVVLLFGFNGVDGSTTMPDESGTPHSPISPQDNAQLDTAIVKFGSAALLLDGTLDCVGIADAGDFDLGGTEDFQIEAWIRFASGANLSAVHTILSHWAATGSNRAWKFQYDGSVGKLLFDYTTGGVTLLNAINVAWSPSVSTWYHVAYSRVGGVSRIFVDGTVLATSSVNNFNPFNPATSVRIGAVESSGSNVSLFHGSMDELRFTRVVGGGSGTQLYTAAFTPPSAEFPRS